MRWPWLAALLLPLAGCEWIFPFASRTGDALTDDGPRRDGPADDSPRGDGPRRDGPLSGWDLRLCSENPCCVEADPLLNPTCSKACTPDCDDLPTYRDPWPLTCNRAVLAEPFLDLSSPWLGRSHCSGVFATVCGELRALAPAHTTVMLWLSPAGTVVPPGHLLEVRVRPVTATTWKLGVQASANTPNNCSAFPFTATGQRGCGIDRYAGMAELWNEVGTSVNETSVSTSAVDSHFVLQSYVQGSTHHCRLVSGGTVVTDFPHTVSGTLPNAVSLIVTYTNEDQTSQREMAVDFLRVFAP